MKEQHSRFSPVYLFAALYIIAVYAFVPLLILFNKDALGADPETKLSMQSVALPLLIPVIPGLLNLAAVLILRRKLSREQLLSCALAVKYALIPFYILGGLCIAAALLLMFTPVVIMVFIGPAVALIFSAAGWLILLGSAPFSIGYLVHAGREGIHERPLCIAAGILQFFFTADVVSMMVLALREKKWLLATRIVIAVLVIAVLAAVVWSSVTLSGAFR